jgi:hypothetical protein
VERKVSKKVWHKGRLFTGDIIVHNLKELQNAIEQGHKSIIWDDRKKDGIKISHKRYTEIITKTLHLIKPYYAFGKIIKRPRGYVKCQRCGMVIHVEDGDVVKKGDGSCEYKI